MRYIVFLIFLSVVAAAQQHDYEGYRVKVTSTMVNRNGVRRVDAQIAKGKARDGVRYFRFSCNATDQYCFPPQKKKIYVIGIAPHLPSGDGIYKCGGGNSNYMLREEGSGQFMVICLDTAY